MKSLRMRTIVGWQRAGVKATIGLTMLAACDREGMFRIFRQWTQCSGVRRTRP
jgi:hypothetical protein